MKKSNYSDYWLDDYNISVDNLDDRITEKTDFELLKLISAKRAISNYVSIINGFTVPVYFSGDTSYTTGKYITISSNINKPKEFDVNVGLALHESSHIKYSDFDLLNNLWMTIPDTIHEIAEELNISKQELVSFLQLILNFVEDRYIDCISYKLNPGYRPYYVALYKKYFNNSTVSNALKSKLYTSPSIESYLFRIINFVNSDRDLNALPNLDVIFDTLDINNISRLKTSTDRMECAFQIGEIVLKSIDGWIKSEDFNLKKSETGSGFGEGDDESNNSDESDESDASDESAEGSNKLSADDLFGENTSKNISITNKSGRDVFKDIGEDPSISDSMRNRISNFYKRQSDFLMQKVKKPKIKQKHKLRISALEQSNVELIRVGNSFFKMNSSDNKFSKFSSESYTECVVFNKVNQDYFSSDHFILGSANKSSYIISENEKIIQEGIKAGIKLGRNLQIRNQEIVEKFNHKLTGKLDKHNLYLAGTGMNDIFCTYKTTKYKPINFHIDVDMSSSMTTGNKWDNTLKMLVTISKAITMLSDVKLKIAMRTTGDKGLPYYYVVFNSETDDFSKIKNCFKLLYPSSFTPEGLCFEAASKMLKKVDTSTDNVFINISDGEPYIGQLYDSLTEQYVGYTCDTYATKYTRNQVNNIRKLGYNVISYFIYDNDVGWWGTSQHSKLKSNFKYMYGDDAVILNTNKFDTILNSMNKTLMSTYSF